MATPHIAGAMGLFWCAFPSLRHQITASRDALNNAAVHIASTLCGTAGPPNNVYGWGRIDIAAAVGTPPPPTPTPTPAPTATPPQCGSTPTPTPTLCDTGIIQNEGFETGSFPPWVIDGHLNDPVVATNFVHSGTHSAFAGGNPQQNTYCEENSNEPLGDSSFYQQFGPVPASATLSFWHKDCTNDSITFDWQDAYITDSNGNILQTIYHVCDTVDWTNQIVY